MINGKVKSTKYLAKPNDNEFEEMINKKGVFKEFRWYKIKNHNTIYLMLIFSAVLLIPIIIYYAKERN